MRFVLSTRQFKINKTKAARRTMAARLAAMVCALVMAVTLWPAAPAKATIASWERELEGQSSVALATHMDGSVSAASCGGSATTAALNINGDNTVLNTVPGNLTPALNCESLIKVRGSDVMYGRAMQGLQTYLAAYRDQEIVWAIVPPDTCTDRIEQIHALQLGADGKLYMVSGRQSGCTGQEYFLSKIDPTNGTVLFSHSLGDNHALNNDSLMPYNEGFALLGGFPQSRITFYDYDGVVTAAPLAIPLEQNELLSRNAYTHDGRVYLEVVQNRSATPECPYTQVAHRIMAVDVNGIVNDEADTPLGYDYPVCASPGQLRATPSGGVVTAFYPFEADHRLVALDSNLSWMWEHVPTTGTSGDRFFQVGADMFVTTNDNIVTSKRYWRDNQRYKGTELRVLNASTGEDATAAVYTEQLDPLASYNVQPNGIGLAPGRIYLNAFVCGGFDCSNEPSKLYAIPVEGVGFDYPRGTVLGLPDVPPVTPPYSYVAMGDSYSSGEGVPPYDPDTDRPTRRGSSTPINLCHRSLEAYPKVAAAEARNRLRLDGFFACSGATTDDILYNKQNDYRGQPPQIKSLKKIENVDVVTLTIGGNDVGFADFASACFFGGNAECREAHRTIIRAIRRDLPNKLFVTYKHIGRQLDAEAKVFVVGYPQVLPFASGDPLCSMSPTEARLANDVSNELALTMVDQIQRLNDARFSFVSAIGPDSPFTGHELCTAIPYFNNVSVPTPAASFHPNKDGQAAYASLVARELIRLEMIEAY